ncbi:MAG: ABC transporter ATP-binding protein [Thermoprotei archaeon]|nr:MAG: ABC transporter ATP-binding protein [Thermoprotei archaeon]RLF23033.1 MAG: ABC transporter ATP-binding protein [Thermoprotei archaeon]
MSTLLTVRDLRAYYIISKNIAVRAVDGVNLDIMMDEVLGVVGESGCGKTTLANTIIMNIRPPLHIIGGDVVIEGRNITRMRREELREKVWGRLISIIPQSALNSLPPVKRIGDFMFDVMRYRLGVKDKRKALELARQRLEDVKLPPETLGMYPHELSGGMKQRVVIAIATLLEPRLLIADEPTSALDVSTQKVILRILLELKRRRILRSILFITHDIAILRQIADRIAVMYAGKVIEVGSMEEILDNPLHPYTKALINSVITPEPEIRRRGLSYIPGRPPSLIRPPPGCRFHPRCSYAMRICQQREPPLCEVKEGHWVACHLYLEESNRG